MLGIIRVLTTKDNQVLQEHGNRLTELYGIRSKSSCIASQPNGINIGTINSGMPIIRNPNWNKKAVSRPKRGSRNRCLH